MKTFDSLEVAVRVREVIKRAAGQQARDVIPAPFVGRVISVDVKNLRAMVWFPGDEQPMEVRLFSSTIPGAWASRGFPPGSASTATTGYGSMVIVQRLNGKLYVTDVLTGGQFAYDLRSMGLVLITEDSTTAGGSGGFAPQEGFVNCQVTGDINNQQALMFGPFMNEFNAFNIDPDSGRVNISIKNSKATKRYEFVLSVAEFENPANPALYKDRWFRIIPTQTINDSYGARRDWHLDVAFRETQHGFDDAFGQVKEVWFRIVYLGPDGQTPGYQVSVNSNAFVKARSTTADFVVENSLSPREIVGYLGFHNSKMGFWDLHSDFAVDSFERVTSSADALGTADSSEVWPDVVANWTLDGQAAVGKITATNQTHVTTLNVSFAETDMTALVSSPVTALGQPLTIGLIYNFASATDHYHAKILFNTDSTVSWELVKLVANVRTTIGSGTTAMVYTPDQKYWVRVVRQGSTHRIKIWADDGEGGVTEPLAFTGTATDNAITAAGRVGLRANQNAGGTNIYPVSLKVWSFKARRQVSLVVNTETQNNQWHSGPWRAGPLRAARDMQLTLGGPAQYVWNGSRLLWQNGAIYVGGIGRSLSHLSAGAAFVNMPAVGAGIQIFGGSANAVVTTDANGIPIGDGQSLWFGVPPGSRYEELNPYLFLVNGKSALQRFDVPEWAVLVAMRTEVDGRLRLGTGAIVDSWQAVTYATNWSTYSASYHTPSFRFESPDRVALRGLIKHTTVSGTGSMFTLPVGYRPAKAHLFLVSSGATVDGLSRVDVDVTGNVIAQTHLTNGGTSFLSLGEISFSVLP